MSVTDKILKSTVFILGALATVGFVITKNAAAFAWATSGDDRYGDLYRIAQIARFKPSAPLGESNSSYRDSIDEGKEHPGAKDYLFLGDSFSFCDWGEGTFEQQLEQRIGSPLFSIYNNHHQMYRDNPYLLVAQPTSHANAKRVLVYEIAERLIEAQFSASIPTNVVQQETAGSSSSGLRSEIREVIVDNTESRTETLFKHGFLTSPMIVCGKTVVFDLFRKISGETPLYSLHPQFLFFQDEVTCFESYHDEQLVARLADNIATLDRNAWDRFGCILLFVPVPNKITLYSRLATARQYDGFLPRLCSALKSRGVRTVELLPAFERETDLLYWPTDTHWNDLGIRIAIQQTVKMWPEPNSQ
jgi:hypothetical protein